MKKSIEFYDSTADMDNLTFNQKVAYASRLQAVVKVLNAQISSIKDDIALAHRQDYECITYKITHTMSTVYNIPESVRKPYGKRKEITKITIR